MNLTNYIAYRQLTAGLSGAQIGLSVLGYPLLLFRRAGMAAGKRLLVIGGVHGREEITVPLTLALFRDYRGSMTVDLLPLMNPDGVFLAAGGIGNLPLTKTQRADLIKWNGGSDNFRLWKANLRGVDLNVNFDAAWGTGRLNRFSPASENYVGPFPGSEPENQAVLKLLDGGRYDCVLCYHARGEELYHGFGGSDHPQAAKALAQFLNYRALTTPNSAGGVKDYWVQQTGKAGFTIEVEPDSRDYHDLSGLDALIERHSGSWELLERYL